MLRQHHLNTQNNQIKKPAYFEKLLKSQLISDFYLLQEKCCDLKINLNISIRLNSSFFFITCKTVHQDQCITDPKTIRETALFSQ